MKKKKNKKEKTKQIRNKTITELAINNNLECRGINKKNI